MNGCLFVCLFGLRTPVKMPDRKHLPCAWQAGEAVGPSTPRTKKGRLFMLIYCFFSLRQRNDISYAREQLWFTAAHQKRAAPSCSTGATRAAPRPTRAPGPWEGVRPRQGRGLPEGADPIFVFSARQVCDNLAVAIWEHWVTLQWRALQN